MKRCNTCGEGFKDKFSFCPVDGTTLGIVPVQLDGHDFTPAEFHLTLMGEETLARRLTNQVWFVADQVRQAWPSFKSDPIAFSARLAHEGARSFKENLLRPHVLSGVTVALFIMGAIILSVLTLERQARKVRGVDLIENGSELVRSVEIDLREEAKRKDDDGVGAADKGRVGLGKGKGEGSNSTPARSKGGGGGGDRRQAPASQGRVPG